MHSPLVYYFIFHYSVQLLVALLAVTSFGFGNIALLVFYVWVVIARSYYLGAIYPCEC